MLAKNNELDHDLNDCEITNHDLGETIEYLEAKISDLTAQIKDISQKFNAKYCEYFIKLDDTANLH